MKLTKLQLKVLRNSVKLKENPPSFIKFAKAVFFSKCAIIYVVLFGGSVLYWTGGWQVVSAIIAGVGVGFILRDIGAIRISLKLWPVNREVTDWQRVNELIELNEVHNESEI